MKNKNIRSWIMAAAVSVILLLSLAGCSYLGIKIEPPRVTLDNDSPAQSVEEPAQVSTVSRLEEKRESDQEILASFDDAVSNVVDTVLPSVVNIKVTIQQQDSFGNSFDSEGVGSGVIYNSDGYIITNSHVADNAEEMVVTLNDGTEYPATLIGTDTDRDIAVIKIDKTGLTPAEFTSLDYVEVGELAIAVGSPFGLDKSVTLGVISAIGRDLAVSGSELPLIDLIQTDAAINPGNSGGALINTAGQIVGINTIIYSTSGSSAGIGFAIPSDIAVNVAGQIIDSGEAKIPYMGIEIGENTTDITGVYVLNVFEGYPAEKAGIETGDIITAINHVEVETAFELVARLLRYEPGDTVTVSLNRDGQTLDIPLELTEKPEQISG